MLIRKVSIRETDVLGEKEVFESARFLGVREEGMLACLLEWGQDVFFFFSPRGVVAR